MSDLASRFEETAIYKIGTELGKIEQVCPALKEKMTSLAALASKISGQDFKIATIKYQNGGLDLVCFTPVGGATTLWGTHKDPAFALRLSVGSVGPYRSFSGPCNSDPQIARFDVLPSSRLNVCRYMHKGDRTGELYIAATALSAPQRTDRPLDEVDTAITAMTTWLARHIPRNRLSSFVQALQATTPPASPQPA